MKLVDENTSFDMISKINDSQPKIVTAKYNDQGISTEHELIKVEHLSRSSSRDRTRVDVQAYGNMPLVLKLNRNVIGKGKQ